MRRYERQKGGISMEDVRIRKFAQFLINQAVYLKSGDKILIELHGHAYTLAKALVEESYKAGGKPFVSVFDYELEGALVSGIDDQHMADVTSYELARMKDMDAYIDIRATDNVRAWNNVPVQQMAIYQKNYWGPLHLKQRCNHTKWAVRRYPNDAMAQLAGMSDKVHITGPETDISYSIKGIGVNPMSGNRNIPDGEIYTAPVRNSVNGVISYNVPSPYNGFMFSGVKLEFKGGKIINASANNTELLNKILDTDEGARYIGEFAIGVNPVIEDPIGDILFDEKIAGSFHLTPGNCYDNGDNGNHSAIHWDFISIQRPEFGGGEIYFDGELIRKDGMFVVDDLKCLNPENLL